jgi:hypothetical protein
MPAAEKTPIPVQTFVRHTLVAAEAEQKLAPIKIMTEPSRSNSEVKIRPIPVQKLEEPYLVKPENHSLSEGIVRDLLVEIRHNSKTAQEFSGDGLVALKTDTWDAIQGSINSLPAKLQDELKDLYGVIKMLNNLVWFSSEFQRHSNAVTEQYSNILAAIAGKLDELIGNPMFKTS